MSSFSHSSETSSGSRPIFILRAFLLLTTLEGIFALATTISTPSMEQRAFLFGYSLPKLLLIAVLFIILFVFASLTLKACLDSNWPGKFLARINLSANPSSLALLIFFSLYAGITLGFVLFLARGGFVLGLRASLFYEIPDWFWRFGPPKKIPTRHTQSSAHSGYYSVARQHHTLRISKQHRVFDLERRAFNPPGRNRIIPFPCRADKKDAYQKGCLHSGMRRHLPDIKFDGTDQSRGRQTMDIPAAAGGHRRIWGGSLSFRKYAPEFSTGFRPPVHHNYADVFLLRLPLTYPFNSSPCWTSSSFGSSSGGRSWIELMPKCCKNSGEVE